MKIEEILKLIKEEKNRIPIKKILKFEESKIHLSRPQYKDEYVSIFKEVIESEDK
ncbi:hypothetical protein [uncultured Ilyobacter sp.]|uniref:hypothetical protein n=1 Tax=uncultured Ilyobacter sp. TaxID=544433 RepID=UPI0029C043CF|nr:hypothetical protein [uncultured Ilyobacter sp.]